MTTYYLAPSPCQTTFFVPGSNTPGNGVLVFTYLKGTTTKTSVAKDTAGVALHTNPIVLDSGGNLPSASSMWLESGVETDIVYAPSNDTDPPAAAYRTLTGLTGVTPVATSTSQWVAASVPTFVAGTRLRVTGDQTTELHVGRRIKTVNTAATIYSTISSSVFATSTTIGTLNDSGTLDSGLSAISYGFLSTDNPSTPIPVDTYSVVSNAADKSKQVRFDVSAVSSGTIRVITMPDHDAVLGGVSSTWTPTIKGATSATYSLQIGWTVKTNKLVSWGMTMQGAAGLQSGTFSVVDGLPYAASSTQAFSGNIGQYSQLKGLYVAVGCTVEAAQSEVQFRAATAASTSIGNNPIFGSTTAFVRCGGQYLTD